MLKELFPRHSSRYLDLPLLGPVADDFDTWLSQQGYRRRTRRQQARALARIDRDLRRRGHRQWQSLRQADLEVRVTPYRRRDPHAAATIGALLRFLQDRSLLRAAAPAVTRVGALAGIYGAALEDLRGLAPLTIRQHVTTAADFLSHLDYELRPERLAALTAPDVEAFIHELGERLSRIRERQHQRRPGFAAGASGGPPRARGHLSRMHRASDRPRAGLFGPVPRRAQPAAAG